MKRIITAALVSLVAVGVLTGCVFAPPAHAPETPPPTTEQSSVETNNPPDESEASEPTTEPTETQTTPEVTTPSIDEVFLTVVRDEIPWTQQESDADLIALGQQACETVGQLGFEETIFSLATDGTLTEQEMLDLSFIVGAAVGAYCPEYL